MSRPTVYFKKGMLYHQEIVLFDFAPNLQIEALFEQDIKTHYCDLQKRWFMVKNRTDLNDLYLKLKNEGYRIDLQDVLPGKQPALKLSPVNAEICQSYRSYLIGLRMSESTINTYTTFIEQLGRYLDQASIATTDLATLRDFILYSVQHKGYSISTHRQMVSAFKHLIVLYPHLEGVMEHIKRPKRSRFQPQVLSVEEVIHLLQVTRNLKHRFALGMLYSCGLRIGELLHMRLSHVDLLRRQVFVKDGKGRKDRHVGIAANMYPLIQNYLSTYKPQLLLIEGPGGGVYSQSSVRAFLRKSCRLAGITKKVTPHTLRHSYATHMIENGVGLRHVQELLGHSKPETTMLYTHIARKDLLEIKNPLDVAVQKLKSDKTHPNLRLSGDL